MTAFEVHTESYLIVDHGVVNGIYKTVPDIYRGLPIADYGKNLIIPGFVDLHTHAAQFNQRGFGLDMQLLEWLNQYTFPEEHKFRDPDYGARVYGLFVDELVRQGTTRVSVFGTVHQKSNQLLFEILVEKGLGAYVGKVNMDANCPEFLKENTQASLADTEEFLATYSGHSLVKPIVTPRFAPTSTSKLLAGLGRLANRYNIPIQSHLAENQNEIEWVKEIFPKQLEYHNVYQHYGLFGQTPTLMAHCIYLSGHTIDCMKTNKVIAVHCPDSNMNLTSGMMPVRQLLDAGIHVGLGTDIGAGHSLSMPQTIVKAIQLSKVNYLLHDSQKPLTLPEAFYMATKGGGSFFGKVGSFEVGYSFDALVIEDRTQGEEYSVIEQLQRFIYAGNPENITERYIAGEKIEQNNRVL